MKGVYVEHLHRQFGRANLESQTCIGIECNTLGHLAKYAPELGDQHKILIVLGAKVFDLQNGLTPCVRVAAAIKGDERSSLDFGYVIPRTDCPTSIFDYEHLVGIGFQGRQDRA